MNLTSTLSRIGMANTEALGRTEFAKQRMQNELALKQEEAQGQAIGGLLGTAIGAGVGMYQDYQKGQQSADATRGFEARKGFADQVTNAETAGKEGIAENNIPVSPATQRGLDRSAAWRAEAAGATQETPRLSYTKNLTGGMDVREVRNDPARDWENLTAKDVEAGKAFIPDSWIQFNRIVRRF